MNKSFMYKNPLFKIILNSLITLPTPININYWWNLGSLLGLSLLIQLISGIFLSMHYCPSTNMAFDSVILIMQDMNYGWIMRILHSNGASVFFICMYIHIGRGIYYQSFNLMKTWMIGIMIFLLTMMTAFLGYVLPWGQMSFWGATVITNLLSAIPYIGQTLVEWIWGGFSVEAPTLNRFYSFHFILPFIITFMVIIHLTFLHESGSSNPLGINSNMYKILFHKNFSLKDLITFIILIILLFSFMFQYPFLLSDPDNFIKANSMITPIHIKPEWYFLFAYAILRGIPNKLGGVIALLSAILILAILPFINSPKKFNLKFNPLYQINFWMLFSTFYMLTWLGGQEIETPFIELTQLYSILYFMMFINMNWLNKIWFLLLVKY
uniref:Cytochrome b n=2 Tax=Vespa velutina TaxID=202808 RepID=A0A347YEK1_VESVE|nr:cytochrome b [Vespa velutina]AQT19238.1 cytochrome b [Vespa velutina nigrithorax]BAX73961.1 cytochrome b [Vespa velutina]BBC27619.1 cytochrome b [Vespa velutina]BBC27632.1 cytochrome b [Vespa velutina]BBC44293.1 cytochrome b [Vespa velutina]